MYCSNPTSPGGGFRSAFGRMFFKANEMTQAVEAPDVVRNKVSFSLLGFLEGEVSLKGNEWHYFNHSYLIIRTNVFAIMYNFLQVN